MMEKHKSRRIRVEIRRILLRDWDPIGVKDAPMAQDEYDSYLGDVLGLLERHVSPDEIADYLHQVETASMGLVDGDGKALVPDERRGTVVSELQRMFHREMLEG